MVNPSTIPQKSGVKGHVPINEGITAQRKRSFQTRAKRHSSVNRFSVQPDFVEFAPKMAPETLELLKARFCGPAALQLGPPLHIGSIESSTGHFWASNGHCSKRAKLNNLPFRVGGVFGLGQSATFSAKPGLYQCRQKVSTASKGELTRTALKSNSHRVTNCLQP